MAPKVFACHKRTLILLSHSLVCSGILLACSKRSQETAMWKMKLLSDITFEISSVLAGFTTDVIHYDRLTEQTEKMYSAAVFY